MGGAQGSSAYVWGTCWYLTSWEECWRVTKQMGSLCFSVLETSGLQQPPPTLLHKSHTHIYPNKNTLPVGGRLIKMTCCDVHQLWRHHLNFFKAWLDLNRKREETIQTCYFNQLSDFTDSGTRASSHLINPEVRKLYNLLWSCLISLTCTWIQNNIAGYGNKKSHL